MYSYYYWQSTIIGNALVIYIYIYISVIHNYIYNYQNIPRLVIHLQSLIALGIYTLYIYIYIWLVVLNMFYFP